MFGDDSDYVVEQYIRPTKVAVPLINDERADILGNFDDDDAKFNKRKIKKRKEIISASEENPFDGNDDATHENGNESDIEMNEENNDDEMPEKNHNSNEDASGLEFESEPDTQNGSERDEKSSASQIDNDNKMEVKKNTKIKEKPSQSKSKNNTLKSEKTKPTTFKKSDKKVDISDDQMKALIRGSSKQDRYVLYVTNLNYSTTREQLTDFFGVAGSVKSIRIPKVRRSAFAFVEMADPTSFKNALALHNRTLDNYTIKVQISEGGKKKSANKKNILKQKNRKLAEMRNETKQFQRSGKGYDKTIKKEIKQQKIQQNRRLAKKAAKKNKI